MARYRFISTHIWNDPDFADFDSESKLLFLYILSNEAATVSGIYVLPRAPIISIQTGVSVEALNDRFEKFKNIEYDKDSHTVFVRNFLDYNPGGRRDLIEKSIANDFKRTKSSKFWLGFIKKYPEFKSTILPLMDDKPEPEADEIKEEGKKLSKREEQLLALFEKHVALAKGNGYFPAYDLEDEEFRLRMLKNHKGRLDKCWKNTKDHFPGEDVFEILVKYLEWFHDPSGWFVRKGVYGISQAFPTKENAKLIDYINRSRDGRQMVGEELEEYKGEGLE